MPDKKLDEIEQMLRELSDDMESMGREQQQRKAQATKERPVAKSVEQTKVNQPKVSQPKSQPKPKPVEQPVNEDAPHGLYQAVGAVAVVIMLCFVFMRGEVYSNEWADRVDLMSFWVLCGIVGLVMAGTVLTKNSIGCAIACVVSMLMVGCLMGNGADDFNETINRIVCGIGLIAIIILWKETAEVMYISTLMSVGIAALYYCNYATVIGMPDLQFVVYGMVIATIVLVSFVKRTPLAMIGICVLWAAFNTVCVLRSASGFSMRAVYVVWVVQIACYIMWMLKPKVKVTDKKE